MEAACLFDKTWNFFSFDRVVIQRRQANIVSPTGGSYLRNGLGCSMAPSLFVVSSTKNLSSSCHLTGFGPHFVGSSDGAFASYQNPELSSDRDMPFGSFPIPKRLASPRATPAFSGRRKYSGVECKCLSSFFPTGSMTSTVESRKVGRYGGTIFGLPSTGVLTALVALRFPAQSDAKHCSGNNYFFIHGQRAKDQRRADLRALRFSMSSSKGRRRRPFGFSHRLCEATGQIGTGQPVPEEGNPGHGSEQNEQPGNNSDLSPSSAASMDSEPAEVDWRAFRARLVVTEHNTAGSDDLGSAANDDKTSSIPVAPLGTRWAHSILAPEAGCVLIATDKIDGQEGFERSVILLLSPGSSKPREGPYGLILNRPLSCRIKDIRSEDRTLVKFFGNCQVHYGGPLDEDMFLLLHGTAGVRGYREVIPGVYYGAASGLEEIIRRNGPMDYRFFFGYSGWSVDQLKKEIAAGLWFVAACSTDLITGHSAAGLWEEILLLMGGKYGELSKRPRRRHF